MHVRQFQATRFQRTSLRSYGQPPARKRTCRARSGTLVKVTRRQTDFIPCRVTQSVAASGDDAYALALAERDVFSIVDGMGASQHVAQDVGANLKPNSRARLMLGPKEDLERAARNEMGIEGQQRPAWPLTRGVSIAGHRYGSLWQSARLKSLTPCLLSGI